MCTKSCCYLNTHTHTNAQGIAFKGLKITSHKHVHMHASPLCIGRTITLRLSAHQWSIIYDRMRFNAFRGRRFANYSVPLRKHVHTPICKNTSRIKIALRVSLFNQIKVVLCASDLIDFRMCYSVLS